jgi:hypothetical protein
VGQPPAQSAQGQSGQQSSEQSGAFNAKAARDAITSGFDAQRGAFTRALQNSDAKAAQTLLANPQTPAALKPILEATTKGSAPLAARTAALASALKGLEAAQRAALEGVGRVELAFKQAFTDAIGGIYRIGILIILLGLIITALLPELPLRKSESGEAVPAFG